MRVVKLTFNWLIKFSLWFYLFLYLMVTLFYFIRTLPSLIVTLLPEGLTIHRGYFFYILNAVLRKVDKSSTHGYFSYKDSTQRRWEFNPPIFLMKYNSSSNAKYVDDVSWVDIMLSLGHDFYSLYLWMLFMCFCGVD